MSFRNLISALLLATISIGCYESDEPNTQTAVDGLQVMSNLSPKEYAEWTEQSTHFLVREKTMAEFNYKVKYLPTEQLVIRDLEQSNKEVTAENILEFTESYEGMEYFEMRIQVDGFNDELAKYKAQSTSDYQQRIAYMAFEMQKNLSMETESQQNIPCKLFHFERTYGIAPYATFLFAFSKEDIAEGVERTVVYDDQLFNKGRLKFNWSFNEVELPKLASL